MLWMAHSPCPLASGWGCSRGHANALLEDTKQTPTLAASTTHSWPVGALPWKDEAVTFDFLRCKNIDYFQLAGNFFLHKGFLSSILVTDKVFKKDSNKLLPNVLLTQYFQKHEKDLLPLCVWPSKVIMLLSWWSYKKACKQRCWECDKHPSPVHTANVRTVFLLFLCMLPHAYITEKLTGSRQVGCGSWRTPFTGILSADDQNNLICKREAATPIL